MAFAESLAIVGPFVPAAAVMFADGALVGNGSLDRWATLAAANLGAVVGDGLSIGSWSELGRRQEVRVRARPLLRHQERAVARGKAFLRKAWPFW